MAGKDQILPIKFANKKSMKRKTKKINNCFFFQNRNKWIKKFSPSIHYQLYQTFLLSFLSIFSFRVQIWQSVCIANLNFLILTSVVLTQYRISTLTEIICQKLTKRIKIVFETFSHFFIVQILQSLTKILEFSLLTIYYTVILVRSVIKFLVRNFLFLFLNLIILTRDKI